jgi:hypothetical protein
MNIGSLVSGVDVYGNNITGKIENVVRLANVAIVKTHEDRLGVTHCHISDLTEQEQTQ